MNSTVHYMVMATTKSNGARYPQWGKFFDATPLLGGAGGGFDSGGLAMDGGGTMAVAGGEVVGGRECRWMRHGDRREWQNLWR